MKKETFDYDSIHIVKLPNNVLRKISKDVPIPLSQEDIDLAEKMIFHIDDSQKDDSKFQAGVGVAAVQYGILKRVFYINNLFDTKEKGMRDVLFNPKIISKSKQLASLSEGEGCLSVPLNWKHNQVHGYVPRSYRIVVEAYSYFERKWKIYDVFGYRAIIMQHELDHLDGHVFFDRINTENPFDKEDLIII
ncbi:peptide deformylase [Mycoplasmopsis lipophila]|uniref:peptide deformylase n=1 Tax=Mycoplasmopsis lipophila TaxID=2117 RepID=UPI0038737395